jgi:hypothetical protein
MSDTMYFHYLNWKISILLLVLRLLTGTVFGFAGKQEGRSCSCSMAMLFFHLRTLCPVRSVAGLPTFAYNLKAEAEPYCKTLVNTYQTALRYNSQDHNQRFYRRLQTKLVFHIFRKVSRTVMLHSRFAGRLIERLWFIVNFNDCQ